jgi:hypothetical protein
LIVIPLKTIREIGVIRGSNAWFRLSILFAIGEGCGGGIFGGDDGLEADFDGPLSMAKSGSFQRARERGEGKPEVER